MVELLTRHQTGRFLHIELARTAVDIEVNMRHGSEFILQIGKQLLEQMPRLRTEYATTHLVAWERSQIHYQTINTSLFQQATTSGAGGAGSNDQYIYLS